MFFSSQDSSAGSRYLWIIMLKKCRRLKSIRWVNSSARSSFFEKGIILTKTFQPSHKLSFFEKGIIVQYFLLSEWALDGTTDNQTI